MTERYREPYFRFEEKDRIVPRHTKLTMIIEVAVDMVGEEWVVGVSRTRGYTIKTETLKTCARKVTDFSRNGSTESVPILENWHRGVFTFRRDLENKLYVTGKIIQTIMKEYSLNLDKNLNKNTQKNRHSKWFYILVTSTERTWTQKGSVCTWPVILL